MKDTAKFRAYQTFLREQLPHLCLYGLGQCCFHLDGFNGCKGIIRMELATSLFDPVVLKRYLENNRMK